MCGAILSLPQCALVAWCLVKHRDNFTFTFRSEVCILRRICKGRLSSSDMRFIDRFQDIQFFYHKRKLQMETSINLFRITEKKMFVFIYYRSRLYFCLKLILSFELIQILELPISLHLRSGYNDGSVKLRDSNCNSNLN
jgi:hypothetical protein